MKRLHDLSAAIAMLLCLFASSSHAAFLTDLWWQPGESGWGANVVHQDDVAFVTLFVYAPAGEPTWYVATATEVGLLPGGLPVVSGPLYRTRGPWFGGAFDPSHVQVARVGNLSITPTSLADAQFEYDIDGVSVSKTVTRQTLRVPVSEPASLGYTAALSLTLRAPDRLPQKSRVRGTAEVRVASDVATLIVHADDESCVYRGPIVQQGKFGSIDGTYACTDGRGGTVAITELEFSRNAFHARIAMSTPAGILAGTIAGAAR